MADNRLKVERERYEALMPVLYAVAEALQRARSARSAIGREVGGRDLSIAITKLEEAGVRLNHAFFSVDDFNPLAAHIIDKDNEPINYQLVGGDDAKKKATSKAPKDR